MLQAVFGISQPKGCKVTNAGRDKLVGVACASLVQLKAKARQKLNVSDTAVVALEDGTLVEDEAYFASLPAQTVFVLYEKDQDIMTGVDMLLNALRSVNASYLKAGAEVEQFVQEKLDELTAVLGGEKACREGRGARGSSRGEDPAWFQGLDTNDKSKEAVMARKARDRVRGYLYKFQEDARKTSLVSDAGSKQQLEECLSYFKKQLAVDEYFGCYFDRRAAAVAIDDVDCLSKRKCTDLSDTVAKRCREADREEPDGRKRPSHRNETEAETVEPPRPPRYERKSYCDETGRFACQGRWQVAECEHPFTHTINPYLSRQSRILFSTWNLDHRIEKSRTVMPTLLNAIQERRPCQRINWMYFYELLFTNYNLKLVHVVCHDKTAHSCTCDSKDVYLQ